MRDDIDWNDLEVIDKVETLAEDYYNTYCKATDYTNWQGLRVPEWAVLPGKQKNAWREVAKRSTIIFVEAHETM